VLEVDHRCGPWLGELGDPPVVHLADGHRIEEVELLPALPARGHEVGVLQDREMLHHAEPGHLREFGAQRRQGAAVLGKEPVEQQPSVGVRERPEHRIHRRRVGHIRMKRDRMVTCQG
jgi:hypothetical protein